MKDPQIIETIKEKSTYEVPTYIVTDQGIEDASSMQILFCKGDKSNSEIFRQPGFFTESLLEVCAQYLRENNVGELSNRDTSMAISHIEDAILRLQKRSADRKRRGVQQTYKK